MNFWSVKILVGLVGLHAVFLLLIMLFELWWSRFVAYDLDIPIAIHVQPNLRMYTIKVILHNGILGF